MPDQSALMIIRGAISRNDHGDGPVLCRSRGKLLADSAVAVEAVCCIGASLPSPPDPNSCKRCRGIVERDFQEVPEIIS